MSSAAESRQSVFEQYTGDVYGWAYRLLGRHHDALDVVQDVFIRWNDQCSRSVPDHARGWLRRVTINRSIDVRRRRHDDGEAPMLFRAAPEEASHQDVGRRLDDEQLREDIAAALGGLTDVQRAVLVAKVYDDMSFSAVAAETGLSVSTVKTHYLRGVRAVRDRLRPRWNREIAS